MDREFEAEARDSRRRRMRELMSRAEWVDIFAPAVRAWMESISWHVLWDTKADLDTIRLQQGKYMALSELLRDPINLLRWLDQQ